MTDTSRGRLWSGALSWLARALSPRKRGAGKSAQIVSAIAATAGVTAGCALTAMLLAQTTPARSVESFLYDLRIALSGRPASSPILIVKIDDEALHQMRDRSECRCLSPIDKAWLGDLIAAIGAGKPRAIGVDYMLDIWRDPEEAQDFSERIGGVTAPIIAVAPPASRPGVDFTAIETVRYADARALVKDDYDDVVRTYDPQPDGRTSFAREIALALNVGTPTDPIAIAYRAPRKDATAENAGALATSVSASRIGDLPPSFFSDRIVLVGRVTRSAGNESPDLIEDMHATPLRFIRGHHDGTPGVEVHAHALDQMLRGDRITTPGWPFAFPLILAAALAGCVFGRSSLRWWATTVVILLSIASVFAVSAILLYGSGWMVELTSPGLAFALSYFITGRITSTQLRADRALYAGTLERYLAPQVIERIVDGREPVEIGASSREITVLATDIADFSVLVGGTDPALFSSLINGYFDGVIDVLWRHEAMLDKLTGDGLIAIFGAPVEQADHAQRAIACAREIDLFAEAYRAQVSETHSVRFGQTRMGLHSGPALVGNFGGDKRFNYTAYGETVVIAARLEAANKSVGSRILVSRSTVSAAGEVKNARSVGLVELKGVSEPVEAYALSG